MEKTWLGSQDSAQSGCTGQCPVRQAGICQLAALGFRRQRTAINHRTVRWCIGLSGEPIVGRANGRPRNPRATRGRANGQKGAADCPVCTGQCPVRQATEGKNCFPRLLSTAPSCLGAIKGTPRRMEEHTKHSYNIHKHQDIDSAPLIPCDSN